MKRDKIESIIILLFGGILFFTGMLFIAEKFFNSDGQIFQVIAGLITGFSGSLFTRLKQANPEEGQLQTGSQEAQTIVNTTTQEPH